MAGFLYFIESSIAPDAKVVKLHGLDYAISGDPIYRQAAKGPDGAGAGYVLANRASMPLEKLGFFPSRQTWRRIPRSIAHARSEWVGMYHDDRPTPEDLLRADAIRDAYILPLADGNSWLVPTARAADDSDGAFRCVLPRRLDLNDAGEFCPGAVVDRYARLEQIAAAHAEWYLSPEPAKRTLSEDAALEVLATNYRISRIEAVMLGVFTYGGRESLNVLNCCIDLQGYLALKKKAESAGSSSFGGLAAKP